MGLDFVLISSNKNKKGSNKKGVIFTVLAIVLAVFFTLVFSARIEKPVDYKTGVIETRISILNDYMESFFDYAREVGSITGYSALQGVIQDLNTPPKGYNPNFETQYAYCIRTGNLTSSKTCPGMINKTLTHYLDNLRDVAKTNLNINSDYRINNINVTQSTGDAFSIGLIINLSVDIDDAYANISDTRLITSIVSIEGLPDPLYLLNGTYNQTIKRTSINKPAGEIGGFWNHTDLQQLYYNHEYRNYYDGISFIRRIKGDLAYNINDKYGIESFVNHTHPAVVARTTDNHSMVDYLFWQDITLPCEAQGKNYIVKIVNDSIINSSGKPRDFQLDDHHRLNFNISSEDAPPVCS